MTYVIGMAIDRSATSEAGPLRNRSAETRGWGENRDVTQASGLPPSLFSPEPSSWVAFFLRLEIVVEVIGLWAVSWLAVFVFWKSFGG